MAILKLENFQSNSNVLSKIVDLLMVESKLILDKLNIGANLVPAMY